MTQRRRQSSARRAAQVRRRRLILAAIGIVAVLALIRVATSGSSDSSSLPSRAALAGMSVRERIVAFANSQVGYRTDPSNSYCNKFSSYWRAGDTGCPRGERSEEWCADFAAWAWQRAGVDFTYGYEPGDINAGAASFYLWGVDHGEWHPASDGYVARPGDVAVYGLALDGPAPSAAHVAVVTGDAAGQPGPDVINGDGDRTGFSVVETGANQLHADTGHRQGAVLAGYVSPGP